MAAYICHFSPETHVKPPVCDYTVTLCVPFTFRLRLIFFLRNVIRRTFYDLYCLFTATSDGGVNEKADGTPRDSY